MTEKDESDESVEGTVEGVEEAVEEAGDVSPAAEPVELRHEHEIHIDEAVEEVEETVEQQRRKVEKQAEDAIDTVEETLDEMGETVEEKREEMETKFEKGAEETLGDVEERAEDVGERLDRLLDAVDDSFSRLLAEALDTDTRVAVYVTLRKIDGGTVEEVAEESGLYPANVESVLEELRDDGVVERRDDVYSAAPPTRLVTSFPGLVASRIGDAVPSNDTRTETKVEAEYDDEKEEATIRVTQAGDADFLNVLVDDEVRHTFQSPEDGDEVVLKKETDAEIAVETGTVRYG